MWIGLAQSRRLRPLLLSVLVAICLFGVLAPAAAVANGASGTPEHLFGRCPLFDRIIREELLPGKITASQAFAELDSHSCPIIRGAEITSARQLQAAVEKSVELEASGDGSCRRLDQLTAMVWDGSGSARRVMDGLVAIDCPSLTTCEQFSEIKAQYASGELAPSKAIQQLVQWCPHFSPQAQVPGQQDASLPDRAVAGTGAPPGKSMADECRRLSDMLYTVTNDRSPADAEAALRVMDTLCETKVRIINNCPLFQSVKARYKDGVISAQEGIGEMKISCPILSKELNPAMIFNFEEYGMHRDPHYDLGHESHSHGAEAGCGGGGGSCCGSKGKGSTGAAAAPKRLVKRQEEHDDEKVCRADSLSGCSANDHFAGGAVSKASGLERLLGGVFPKGNPALSSLLATFYISLFPNLILFATPTSIPNKALRVMVGFAVGGLLGDVFLHLLPHMFNDDHGHDHHGDEPHNHARNTVYGCAIFLGLMVFFSVDKFMRLLGGSGGHSHSHGHEHHGPKISGASSASESDTPHRVRKRRPHKAKRPARDANEADDEKEAGDEGPSRKDVKKPVKLSAYLNLMADAAHNFTDGLAMSASFYLSHAAGLSTFVAVFFHEIPHELGDFAILVQSGFSRTSALASQFFTALGAIAGTIAGILIEEAGKGNSLDIRGLYTPGIPAFAPAVESDGARSLLSLLFGSVLGLLPSSVAGVPWSKLVIPFTAGGFIYVGTVSVLPDLLQPDNSECEDMSSPAKGRMARYRERRKLRGGITMAFVELGAMLVGLGIMAAIALSEE
ncbi:hypothetical protein GGF46_004664 [Coemansia sp. RSA 552]|nr:hypothetical protein GGF46_004664 [Coemansia sp. RSA 552]